MKLKNQNSSQPLRLLHRPHAHQKPTYKYP